MSIKRFSIFLGQYLCGYVCVRIHTDAHMHMSAFSQDFTVETGHLYLCVLLKHCGDKGKANLHHYCNPSNTFPLSTARKMPPVQGQSFSKTLWEKACL